MDMIKICISGCLGRMGHTVYEAATADGGIKVVAGIDKGDGAPGFPVYKSLADMKETPDIIVDFSNHAFTQELLEFAVSKQIPLVIATTGQTPDEVDAIRRASEFLPIFYSRNMSLGVNMLIELAKKAADKLGSDFDIEIIEEHHNQKLDAPSGTALMIAGAIEDAVDYEPEYIYDRHLRREKRVKNEIGIHSVRGGSIVGEHQVIFAGKNEVLRISHSAESREVFAQGAIAAVKFLYGKPHKLYSMTDLVG